MVPGLAPHITTEYSADIRNRTLQAWVSLNNQKQKPHVSIKIKIEKFHKLFDVYTMQYTKDGGSAVAMAMLPPPPTKPITLP